MPTRQRELPKRPTLRSVVVVKAQLNPPNRQQRRRRQRQRHQKLQPYQLRRPHHLLDRRLSLHRRQHRRLLLPARISIRPKRKPRHGAGQVWSFGPISTPRFITLPDTRVTATQRPARTCARPTRPATVCALPRAKNALELVFSPWRSNQRHGERAHRRFRMGRLDQLGGAVKGVLAANALCRGATTAGPMEPQVSTSRKSCRAWKRPILDPSIDVVAARSPSETAANSC